MTLEYLQSLATSLPSVTSDIKWGHDLCFNIGGKMFLVTGLTEAPVTASFKVPDEDFETFSERKGFQPAPYLARYKWVHVDDINRVSKKEWEKLIMQSYELIKSKLPKKVLQSLMK